VILIQLFLILGFIAILLRFLRSHGTYQARAWKKILGILFTLGGILVVLFPESSNDVAHWVGVSRGADLLLYILTVVFIFVVLSLYVKDKQENQRIVQLARKVAILDAEMREKRFK